MEERIDIKEVLKEELSKHKLSKRERTFLTRFLLIKGVEEEEDLREHINEVEGEIKPVKLNKIQTIGYKFYSILRDNDSPDCFDAEDEFVTDMYGYGRQYVVSELFRGINKKLGLDYFNYYNCTKKEVKERLFRIAEGCYGESDALNTIREVLEEVCKLDIEKVEVGEKRIPDGSEALLNNFKEYAETVIQNYTKYASKGKSKKKTGIEMPEGKALEYLGNDKNIMDRMIDRCSRLIYSVEDLWFMSFLQCASIYAPPIRKGGQLIRSSIHILNVGDISTAKSNFSNLIMSIFPKATKADIVSETEWEGVAVKEGSKWKILPSLPERASDGLLILTELDKQLRKREGIIRSILDNAEIDGHKGGITYTYKANVGVLADANPKEDFFVDDMEFRKQISLREGFMSRIDFIKPLFLTDEMIDDIMDRDTEMYTEYTDCGELNLRDIKFILETIRKALSGELDYPKPKYVRMDVKKLRELKKYLRSKKIKGRLPVIIPRTFEKVIRVVVASCCFHIFQRKIGRDGELIAVEQDYENAKRYIDYQIHNLKSLYERTRRQGVETLDNVVYRRIVESGEVELKTFVSTNELCAKSTTYKVIDRLEGKGLIAKNNRRGGCYIAPVRR